MAQRVVVVGHGMAGVRVVEEIRARASARQARVTVLGGERHGAYNRVLLPELLAGRHTADTIALTAPGWAQRYGVDLRLSTPAVAVDPGRRLVRTADGTDLSYDALILATGSRPWLPPITGLADASGALIPGAVTFHTLDDCQAMLAAEAASSPSGGLPSSHGGPPSGGAPPPGEARRPRTVVLGGGVLGLEAACALAGRGLPVEVVHDAGHLMDRQLDSAAGRVLSRILAGLGIRVRVGTRVTAVTTGPDGRLAGLGFADGTRLDTRLLLIACGVRPEVSLAASAGLAVERGVVVDDTLRSVSHRDIYALGECAQHNGNVYGLVAPAFEQASIVAAQVTGEDPAARYEGSRTVSRFKAAGVDLATMGDTAADEDGPDGSEVLHFADPARGTYKKLVIRDGQIAGAILLGDIGTVGTITQLYDRGAPAPADRLSLLFSGCRGGAGADDPAALPALATICHCNGVSKAQIQSCVLAGARSVTAVAAATRATTGCGTCRPAVADLVAWVSSVGQISTSGQEIKA